MGMWKRICSRTSRNRRYDRRRHRKDFSNEILGQFVPTYSQVRASFRAIVTMKGKVDPNSRFQIATMMSGCDSRYSSEDLKRMSHYLCDKIFTHLESYFIDNVELYVSGWPDDRYSDAEKDNSKSRALASFIGSELCDRTRAREKINRMSRIPESMMKTAFPWVFKD